MDKYLNIAREIELRNMKLANVAMIIGAYVAPWGAFAKSREKPNIKMKTETQHC